jgi:hypothetical protein
VEGVDMPVIKKALSAWCDARVASGREKSLKPGLVPSRACVYIKCEVYSSAPALRHAALLLVIQPHALALPLGLLPP